MTTSRSIRVCTLLSTTVLALAGCAIVDARSNRCLGVADHSLDRGALLRKQTCADNDSQRWLLVR